MRSKFNLNSKCDPDTLTPGQLVDLVRQREKYLSELGLVYTNYLPFDQDVYSPHPKQSDSYDTKLNSFYRFIEDQKDLDRRVKVKRERDSETTQIGNIYMEAEQSISQSEMGIRADGQAVFSDGRTGLGYTRQEEDIFQKFRNQKSQAYHANVEDRQVYQKYKH